MKVFYSDLMVANSGSYSPSAGKPALAVQSWVSRGFPVEIQNPAGATRDQLCLAHDEGYVDAVLSLRQSNGFGNRSGDVAKSLRYTSGAMLASARHSVRTGENSCAPVSGFHHAGYDFGGGFCTFNGLMVAALDLLSNGDAAKVGILDCDQHYGNGTDDIIARLGVEDEVVHFTTGRHDFDADWFNESVPDIIYALFSDCDVLIYQAGADPHVNDPLGGWMTTAQLYERDAQVFSTCKRLGLPVAWDLAGGYQRDKDGGIPRVLQIHDNTMRACLQVG